MGLTMISRSCHILGAPTSMETDGKQAYNLTMWQLPNAQWRGEGTEREKCSSTWFLPPGFCSFASVKVCLGNLIHCIHQSWPTQMPELCRPWGGRAGAENSPSGRGHILVNKWPQQCLPWIRCHCQKKAGIRWEGRWSPIKLKHSSLSILEFYSVMRKKENLMLWKHGWPLRTLC